MSRSNYEPPVFRALWRIGFDIPPPHFVPFWKVTLFAAVLFGGVWGAFMWLTVWSRQGLSIMAAFCTTATLGICLGLITALCYAHGRRTYRLPAWSSID
jgi:Na+/H+-dicarboxylate symporter